MEKIRAILFWVYFKVEILDTYPLNKSKVCFRLIPRQARWYVTLFIISPLLIIAHGIIGLWAVVKPLKIMHYSSYAIDKDVKNKKWAACRQAAS